MVFVASVLLVGFITFSDEAFSQATPDINCRITTGGLNAGESLIFTLQNGAGGTDNAHGARPSGDGAYANKVVCDTLNTTSFVQASVCGADESGILSLSNYTNAHAEAFGTGNYGWQACGRATKAGSAANELNCVIRTSCKPFESALVSFQSGSGGTTNAHLASPGTYANQLCCSLRCDGASCITVSSSAPETFAPTDEYATYDIELYNRKGDESVGVELYLKNEADYTDTTKFGKYGIWTFLFANDTGDFYPAQTTIGPKATKIVTFKVKAPPGTPPSTGESAYKFVVSVRDA
ncbi:MAG: hypothetical protein HYS81_04945 [Candidatus Aenigmatarchaeota archaeon]|nr:MAG: hypothetical protein HYS81_04945 [Candidatus Aenigmarchaeota archaeon]